MCKIVIFGFSIIFALDVAGALKENCKEADLLQRCSVPLPVLSSSEITFPLTHEELDKNCVELRAGIKCIENITEVCMEKKERVVFMSIYAGIIDVVHELCTRGPYQDEYLRHAECVKNVRAEHETCSKDYEVTLTTVNHHNEDKYQMDKGHVVNHEDFLKTVCCKFHEYLLCSERTVARSCGEETALFTSAFLKRMASNIIKTFCLEYKGQECSLTGRAAPKDYTSLLSAVTILAVSVPYITRFIVPT